MGLNVKLDLNHLSFKKKHEFYIDDVIFELKMKSWVIQDPLHVLQSIFFSKLVMSIKSWAILSDNCCSVTAFLWCFSL